MALTNFRAGGIPNPPTLWDPQYMRQVIRVLELYFSQLDSNTPNYAQTYTATTFNGIAATKNVTTTEKNALTPSAGWVVFDTTLGKTCVYDGTAWDTLDNSTAVTGVAGAIGATIADYFSSTLSLEASSTYEIECVAYFLKTTAGTVVWTWAFSSAPTAAGAFYEGTPATGYTTTTITGAPVTGEAHVQAQTTMAHAATASLTTAVYHTYRFRVHVRTNAATTFKLRATESAGTITPQTGSYMRATKIV